MARFVFESWEEAKEATEILSESKEWLKEKQATARGLRGKAWKVFGPVWGVMPVLVVWILAVVAFAAVSKNESGIMSLIGKLLGFVVSVINILAVPAIIVGLVYGIICVNREIIQPLGGWSELKIFWPGYTASSTGAAAGDKAVKVTSYLAGAAIGESMAGRLIGLLWKPLFFMEAVWFGILCPPALLSRYGKLRQRQIDSCDKYIKKAQKELAFYEKAAALRARN